MRLVKHEDTPEKNQKLPKMPSELASTGEPAHPSLELEGPTIEERMATVETGVTNINAKLDAVIKALAVSGERTGGTPAGNQASLPAGAPNPLLAIALQEMMKGKTEMSPLEQMALENLKAGNELLKAITQGVVRRVVGITFGEGEFHGATK